MCTGEFVKYLPLVLLLPFTVLGSVILETPNYIVSIGSKCMEGEVSCSSYVYEGKSKKSGNSLKLKGSSWHTTCADGSTPCKFLGYKFTNDNVTYFVHQDGLLEVIADKNKVLISEQGVWL